MLDLLDLNTSDHLNWSFEGEAFTDVAFQSFDGSGNFRSKIRMHRNRRRIPGPKHAG